MRYTRNQCEQDTAAIFEACNGVGTNEETFIRIWCTTTHEEFNKISELYA